VLVEISFSSFGTFAGVLANKAMGHDMRSHRIKTAWVFFGCRIWFTIRVYCYNRIRVMVLNVTFNSISVILVEETRVPRENHRPVASHWQTLSHKVVSNTPCHELD